MPSKPTRAGQQQAILTLFDYPPRRLPPAIEGRAAAPWITGIRKAPLISYQFLSNLTGLPLGFSRKSGRMWFTAAVWYIPTTNM
jgi:hypothetical protein